MRCNESTEPQGLSILCDSERGDQGAGDKSHLKGAWPKGILAARGGPGRVMTGAAWWDNAVQRSPVCSPVLRAIYKNRGKLGRQSHYKSGLAHSRLSARAHKTHGASWSTSGPVTVLTGRGPTSAPGRGHTGPGHIRVGIYSGDRWPIYMHSNSSPRWQCGARVCAHTCPLGPGWRWAPHRHSSSALALITQSVEDGQGHLLSGAAVSLAARLEGKRRKESSGPHGTRDTGAAMQDDAGRTG